MVAQNPCYKHTTKVMLSNEIRIGNLLSYNNSLYSIGEVTEIKKSLIIGMDKVRFGYRTDKLHKFNDCKPIPLTEEWLLKLGFEVLGGKFSYDKGKMSIILGSSILSGNFGRVYFNSWTILERSPKYVHELQNLYFALTQTELTLS